MVNNYLCFRSGFLPDSFKIDEITRTIFGTLFRPEIIRRIDEVWSQNREEYGLIVVLNRTQILTLIKLFLLWGKDGPGLDANESQEARFALGELCLMTTDYMAPENEDSTVDELRSQLLPGFEMTNPPNIIHSIARSVEYLDLAGRIRDVKLGNRTILDLFQDTNGLSLLEYLQLVYLVYIHYEILRSDPKRYFNDPIQLNLSRDKFFKNLTYSEQTLTSFFRLTSRSLDEWFNEPEQGASIKYDLVTFKTTPILWISENVFTCLDIELLVEKLGASNWFHAVRATLPSDPNNPTRKEEKSFSVFQDIWGKKIFEEYVKKKLRAAFQPRHQYKARWANFKFFEESSDVSDASKPRFDCAIFNANSLIEKDEPASLIWIECKTLRLDIGAKYGDDHERLRKTIKTRFELTQIINGIKLMSSNKGNGLTRFANIVYPVMICEDELFGFNLISKFIIDEFEKQIDESALRQDLVIKPLSIVTVELLERLLPYIKSRSFRLEEFLEYSIPFRSLDLREALGSFLKERKIPRRKNQELDAAFGKFHDDIHSLFKTN
jgi:hypothetical protein